MLQACILHIHRRVNSLVHELSRLYTIPSCLTIYSLYNIKTTCSTIHRTPSSCSIYSVRVYLYLLLPGHRS